MRCPNCGTDTGTSSPRCMRCNAPLPPPGPPPPGGDATARDPLGEVPVPRDPLPPPWENPVPWDVPSDYTTPMPPSEQRSTPLSPEPWSEPAIWQPPVQPKKSRLPYFLGTAGVVLLIGVALGIVFWPSGSNTPTPPPAATQPSTRPVETAGTQTEDTGDFDTQAKAVNDLLDDMHSTRTDLGTVVTEDCPVSGLESVLDARQSQLEKARELEVGALDNGTQMRDALVRALEASTESNRRYLDVAPGCPSEGEVADVNQRASSAKSEFIGYWTPIAERAGLPARGESDI